MSAGGRDFPEINHTQRADNITCINLFAAPLSSRLLSKRAAKENGTEMSSPHQTLAPLISLCRDSSLSEPKVNSQKIKSEKKSDELPSQSAPLAFKQTK